MGSLCAKMIERRIAALVGPPPLAMKRKRPVRMENLSEQAEVALRACLIAKDAAFNATDFIATGSRMAFIAVQQCEKELDQIERQIDESTPGAITEVTEAEARELLACLKFTVDLERIGDLIWSVVKRIHTLPTRLHPKEAESLTAMAQTLQEMLARVHEGFVRRDIALASSVLGMDSEIDQACHSIFGQYLKNGAGPRSYEATNVLLMAQAIERAGDHTKNLAEELFHLIEGHSVRR